MTGKLSFLAGLGAGYVLGARAGRERYDEIASRARELWRDPRVQEKAEHAQHAVQDKASQAQQAVKHKVASTSWHASGSGDPGASAGPGTGTGSGAMP